MILSMMAASSRNGAIGKKNGGKDGLPWSRLPADLKAFKEHTSGKPVIMGSTTWKSIDEKPLPKRTNIIISRTLPARSDGVVVVRSLDAAIAAATAAATAAAPSGVAQASAPAREAVIVGGAVVYAEAQPRADRFLLTVVDADLSGDTFLPAVDDAWWCLPPRFVAADDQHAHGLRFYDLWRRQHAPPGAVAFTWDRQSGRTEPRE